ncbi:MAG: type II toxin-antitoxin system HicB family antitoxin [Lachnospiraceae bacterium]|nr:type II toxin-antitoxin system HicB family antitoxin [Lachnospiraceae bacterium]
MKAAYPTFIAQAEDTFLVYVPDLEIYTEGSSFEDAISMARDAIGIHGITLEDEGSEIASPTDYAHALEKAKEDTEVFDYSKGILTMVDVDFTVYRRKMDNRSVRRNVTIPSWLDYETRQADLNVSKVLQDALMEKLGAVK